jgi:tetratricopeptide (TPR) repeat protein
MASPRALLSTEITNLYSSPMTHNFIWMTSIKEFQTQIDALDVCNTQEYLEIVIAYKNQMKANNPKYNDNSHNDLLEGVRESLQKLQSRTATTELQLQAAIYNLLGLVSRDLKKPEAALDAFSAALIDENQLTPLTNAIILSNKFRCLNALGRPQEAGELLYKTINYLIVVSSDLTEVTHLKATICADIANSYQQSGNHDNAVEFYEWALRLWPEANVLANNFAIYLSKLNKEEYLLKSRDVLESHYPHAQKDHLFVTPYYLADVNIKLAACPSYNVNAANTVAALTNAKEAMVHAKIALGLNQNYNPNYRLKALSRMSFLQGNLFMVLEQRKAAEAVYAEAIKLRELVVEAPEKKMKFRDKFSIRYLVFTFATLFRRPIEIPAAAPADVKTQDQDNDRSRLYR